MDHIIQAIEAMARLEEKAEELVRIADIINNTMADTETGTLLTGEGYRTDIATQFYKVAKILRLILHDALSQRFYNIQCNLVNELTTCQGQQSTIIFEDYKNHLLTLINSYLFQKSYQGFPQKKIKQKKKLF